MLMGVCTSANANLYQIIRDIRFEAQGIILFPL